MKETEYEQIHAKVIQIGDSLGITITKTAVTFMGLQKGDQVKIWIKKQEE